MLKLLHTADWHIGKRFPAFGDDDQRRLSRARVDVVGRILDVARRNVVHAVLCAGDLFDEPQPGADFWGALGQLFATRTGEQIPVFLVPGNHDPLMPGSVWSPEHPFRKMLPGWVHVVDRDDFEHPLGPSSVLYARPCRSKAGDNDLALQLPARAPGDDRIRVGCVHGSTFDMPGFQTNFPIARDAAVRRGLDYLAIGDTHAFRDVSPGLAAPTVYPGAPEPTSFDERGAGSVALVSLLRHGVRARVSPERVAYWTWIDRTCTSLSELRSLLTVRDLERSVVRLRLSMSATLAEHAEVGRIVRELRGTDATHGRAGVLLVDESGLTLTEGSSGVFADLPPVLADVVARLDRLMSDAPDDATRAKATRALSHLYKLLQQQDGAP